MQRTETEKPDPSLLRKIRAIRLYVQEGKGWQEVADELGVNQSTLWRWRRSANWRSIMDVALKEIAGDAIGLGYRRLIASADAEVGAPGVTAACQLLNRFQGPVPNEVSGPGGTPIAVTGDVAILGVLVQRPESDIDAALEEAERDAGSSHAAAATGPVGDAQGAEGGEAAPSPEAGPGSVGEAVEAGD